MTQWFKSSYSGGDNNCVEVAHTLVQLTPAPTWPTASYSQSEAACVEVTEGPATGIRDTQNRELGALLFTTDEWQAFLGIARNDLL